MTLRRIMSGLKWRALEVIERVQTLRLRQTYASCVKKLKSRDLARPIRVVFLANENSKWKTQSICEEMLRRGGYEIIVALTMADVDRDLSEKDLCLKMAENRTFFEARGFSVVDLYDPHQHKAGILDALEPDIVFYPHPWGIPEEQMPNRIAHRAITCYVPYFVPTFGNPPMHNNQPLHKQVYRHFVLSDVWAKYYESISNLSLYAGKLVGLGHPMLDQFAGLQNQADEGVVIYAPHWSIPNDKFDTHLNLSTFLLNGRQILDYAKAHPEIKWAFKPHPTLRHTVLKIGAMTELEIDAYYREWEQIGEGCYSGDYVTLFRRSCALITDCDSFLSEYPCTGRPIIHLISPVKSRRIFSPMQSLFDTYYKVHNLDELYHTFAQVLERGEDPQRADRLQVLQDVGLANSQAAVAIVDHLDAILKV